MENTDFMQQYAAEQQAQSGDSSLTQTVPLNPVDTTTAVNADDTITPVETQTPIEELDPLQEFAKTLSAEQLREVEESQINDNSVNEQLFEEEQPDPNAEEILDEDDFISQRTGGQFSTWEELGAALEAQQTQTIRFENETSEVLYNLIAEGKIGEVADILYNKKIADEIKEKPDEDVLKSYIKFQNPEFDSEDIQAEYEEKYSIDEFSFDESKLKREQKKMSQRIKNDVSEAREFFERMSEDIKFPQYERPTEQEDTQVDIEAQEERQKFLESLDGVENRLGALQFNWKDDKASLSINGKFEIPAQEASTYRDAAESLQDYYAERYYQDGKYQSDKLLKDLYIADNFDKIIQSVISQTANQTRLEMLKQRKNITTDVEQGGTYRPSAADEERNLFDQLFMGHKQRQL